MTTADMWACTPVSADGGGRDVSLENDLLVKTLLYSYVFDGITFHKSGLLTYRSIFKY